MIDIIRRDITAMNAKRGLSDPENVILRKCQECLDVENVDKCLQDLGEIAENPSEILGGARKRDSPIQADPTVEDFKKIILADLPQNAPGAGPAVRRRKNPIFGDMDKSEICFALRDVSLISYLIPWIFLGTYPSIVLQSPRGSSAFCYQQACRPEPDSFHQAHCCHLAHS